MRPCESVLVDTGEAVYELEVSPVEPAGESSVDQTPDGILNIIGIGASQEPTNIARHKRAYLADALDPRRT